MTYSDIMGSWFSMIRRIPILVWFIIPTIIIAGAGVWFFSRPSVLGEKGMAEGTGDARPAAVSSPVEGTVEYDIVGRNHIAQGTAGSGYNSNPPTSGPHWPAPAKNGSYDAPLPDEQAIHNLEHGYVWISYKSDVGDDVKNKLKDIARDDDWKVILTPRDADESKIALAAWGRLLKMDEPDYDKIKDFIKTYRNRGPEKTPD